MSENVEIARRFFVSVGRALDEYWANPSRSGVSALLRDVAFDQVDPDAEWRPAGAREAVHGREEWLRAIEEALEVVEDWRPEVEVLIDAGADRVLGTFRISIRGKGSGMPISQRIFNVVTLRDGKIASIIEYTDRTDALKAAGLSE